MIECEICGALRPPLRARNENPLCDLHKHQRKMMQSKMSKRRKRNQEHVKKESAWCLPQFDWVKPAHFDLFIGVMNRISA